MARASTLPSKCWWQFLPILFYHCCKTRRTIQFIKMLDPSRELSRLKTRIGHTAVKGNFSAKIKGDRTWLESLMIMSTCKSTRGHKLNNNNKHLPTFKGMLLVSTFSQLTHSKISRRVTCGMKNLRQTERNTNENRILNLTIGALKNVNRKIFLTTDS